MKPRKVLVMSAWPYINLVPHIGNLVGSVLSADVVARYYRLRGDDVVMVSGSDEHGTPIEVEAIRQGVSPKELTDRNHAKVVELFERWGISFDNYTRTESHIHKEFVRDHLLKIEKNGYVLANETEMLYCRNCHRFLPDRFVEGKCPYCEHEPARGDQCDACGRLLEPTNLLESYCVTCKGKPVIRKTKHWYFDLSRFSQRLKDYINDNELLPNNTRSFSLNLIEEGLKPRAITRDVRWGIPAPFLGAEDKTIYVWVEAVLGYISATIEYFKNSGESERWKEFWLDQDTKTIYFIGKDNIPFHTIILPALLLASHEDYNLPWNVSTTEFLQFKGEKASKSQRIGVSIDEALEILQADYWRYFLVATRPETKDTNFTWDLLIEKVNSDLNDAFGNFIHRTLTFIKSQFDGEVPEPSDLDEDDRRTLRILADKVETIASEVEACRLQSAANILISISRVGNRYLNEKEPWNVIKRKNGKAENTIYVAARIVKALATVSAPFVPFAAEKLWQILNMSGSVHGQRWGEALKPMPTRHRLSKTEPLFEKVVADAKAMEEMLTRARKSLARAV